MNHGKCAPSALLHEIKAYVNIKNHLNKLMKTHDEDEDNDEISKQTKGVANVADVSKVAIFFP